MLPPAANCAFLFLQVVLAPLLYPHGYLLQIAGVLAVAWRHKGLRSRERRMLDPLLFVLLLSNTILGEGISLYGYTVRFVCGVILLYASDRLHTLSSQMVDPYVALFLAIESLAAPHLYPYGYIAQLTLYHFLVWNDDPVLLPSRSSDGVSMATKKNALLDDSFSCKICFENKVNVCFSACGHCCCQQCSDYLTNKMARAQCPFCNRTITKKIPLYFP